ncbi:hypothetical protein E4U09_007588 [Claviceps aff. purpurea]|uniref:Uncharacterized protein n=1 Tax=Claviceps aff. purpurea TaxID=1967640 RepID=A0A9P7U2P5_9HYPO|nr:hypothetical protein E4U09_007588 [Claviceps aff. purpurea]
MSAETEGWILNRPVGRVTETRAKLFLKLSGVSSISNLGEDMGRELFCSPRAGGIQKALALQRGSMDSQQTVSSSLDEKLQAEATR